MSHLDGHCFPKEVSGMYTAHSFWSSNFQYRYGRNCQKLGSSHQCSKELQITKPTSMQAKLLVLSSNGKAKAWWLEPGWQKRGGQRLGFQGHPGQHLPPHGVVKKAKRAKRRGRVLCSEDLHSWQGGGKEVTY